MLEIKEYIYEFAKDMKPVAKAKDNEVVKFIVEDCFAGQIKSEKDIARFKKQISLIEAINGGHPEEKGEKVNQKVEFIVKAIIVRVVDTIQKRTIGCKFLAINEELSKYVNEKQMEKRRMKLK